MIADDIPKTEKSLVERGLPANSYFAVMFADGSMVSEIDTNWSAFSKRETVKYFDKTKVCFVSIYPIKSIVAYLDGLEAKIENIPEDTQVFQFINSQRLFANNVDHETIVGRGIGLIKDGRVIEERFINAIENEVQGVRI